MNIHLLLNVLMQEENPFLVLLDNSESYATFSLFFLSPPSQLFKCTIRPPGCETNTNPVLTSFTWPLAIYDSSSDRERVLGVRVQARSLTV